MENIYRETAIIIEGKTVDYSVEDFQSEVILKQVKEFEGEKYIVTWFFDVEDYEWAMDRRGIIDLPYEWADYTVEVA